ncbi:MAG: hypothetical protein ABGZ19_09180 [Verrucomicrobiales bacterium]
MPTLCRDVDDVNFKSDRVRIAKQEGEVGLAPFIRWITLQADGWCSIGLCASGTCKGHLRNTEVSLLEETDEYIDVGFSTTIYCSCDGGESSTDDTGSSSVSSGGNSADDGKCSQAEEDAEFQQMIGFYTDAVNNARQTGYQAGNDAGYSDPGFGMHRVGNCADWQQVSWSALVTRVWKCWKIQQIRARRDYSVFSYHHFVRLEGTCSGRVVYLDPWNTGNPDKWEAADFPFEDGNGWVHTDTHTHGAGDNPRDPGND